MHEVDVANLYKWMFKTACAVLILSNTFNIVMAVFDVSQNVISRSAGLIQGCVVLVLSLQSCASSLITLGNAAAGAVGATTYPAQDGDMLGAEAAYCSLEAELQHYLDTYESTHDYDEYHFDLDAIEHDPYGGPISYANLNSSYWQAHFFDSLLIDNRFLTCLSRTGYAMIN